MTSPIYPRVGDTVNLRSGGDSFARCEWIDGTGVPQSKEYPIDALVLVSPITSSLPQE